MPTQTTMPTPESTQNPQELVSPVPEVSPLKTANKTIPILLGFLLLVLIAVVGTVYFGARLKSEPLPSTETPVTETSVSDTTEPATFETTNVPNNQYTNAEYGISFSLLEGERVVECPNKTEVQDTLGLYISTAPAPADPAINECATDSVDGMLFMSKKTDNAQPIEAHISALQGEGYNYTITRQPYTVGAVVGVHITGNRDNSTPAPLPDQLDEYLFEKDQAFYLVPALYIDHGFNFN